MNPSSQSRFRRTSFILLLIWLCSTAAPAADFLGFDVSNAIIPSKEILRGGPPRDGIPSIDQPKFIGADQAHLMRDDDLVVSLTVGSETRAYPLRILVWHEIVNDTIAGLPVAVTYCPLCGTAMVFDRRYGGRELTFAVSGLLFQSDVLMYDRQTETLWSQLGLKAVAGKLVGQDLIWLPAEHLKWKAWRAKYPRGQVLSNDTGYDRDYGNLPYGSYESSPRTMFPVPQPRKELPTKEWIIGIMVNGRAKAYPLATLPSDTTVEDVVGGITLRVTFDRQTGSFNALRLDTGEAVPFTRAYWFAWQAFNPTTDLWTK